jgi:hypothetical protein
MSAREVKQSASSRRAARWWTQRQRAAMSVLHNRDDDVAKRGKACSRDDRLTALPMPLSLPSLRFRQKDLFQHSRTRPSTSLFNAVVMIVTQHRGVITSKHPFRVFTHSVGLHFLALGLPSHTHVRMPSSSRRLPELVTCYCGKCKNLVSRSTELRHRSAQRHERANFPQDAQITLATSQKRRRASHEPGPTSSKRTKVTTTANADGDNEVNNGACLSS